MDERVKQRHKEQSKRHKTSVLMYLWSPLFLAHFSHFLETYKIHSLSPFVLERN